MLVFLLETGDMRTVRYYCRVIQTSDDERLHVNAVLSFVSGLHDMTFTKDDPTSLTKYLESNSSGDNSTFAHVDIHSSYRQVTWGDLPIAEHTAPYWEADVLSGGQLSDPHRERR